MSHCQSCRPVCPERRDEEFAKALYYAFVEGVGGVNHDGRPYGTWEEVRNNSRSEAWFAVARKAREYLSIVGP
jgi:hypothetical protein